MWKSATAPPLLKKRVKMKQGIAHRFLELIPPGDAAVREEADEPIRFPDLRMGRVAGPGGGLREVEAYPHMSKDAFGNRES